ncbi:MAG: dimer protein [Acidobacteriota bacterium]|nr:dimer protein [Acidobacteriota bacterium]
MTTQPTLFGVEGGGLPQELLQDAVALLTRFAATSSPSDDPQALERMAAALAGELQARDLAVAIRAEPDEHGVLLPVVEAVGRASGPAGDSRLPILLVGHFDTVLSAAPPRLEGGRLFATGAIDMKGGIVAFLKALDLVALRGGRRPALRLVLVPDEEVGGAISRRAVATAGSAARALWVLEPGEPTAGGETLVTGRRGMFHWRLAAHGRTSHSGLAFWQGRSAAVAIAEWIERAAALSRPQGGPTINVARLVAGERSFVDSLAAGARTSLGTAHLRNVVPDHAVAEGEARFLRSAEAETLEHQLSALASAIAARHEVAMDFSCEATVAPVDPARSPRAHADLAVRLAAEAGWRLEREEDRGGISFPNFLPDPGRIPVLDGLGPVGGGMHTRTEFVEVASLARRIRLLADLLRSEAPGSATAGD